MSRRGSTRECAIAVRCNLRLFCTRLLEAGYKRAAGCGLTVAPGCALPGSPTCPRTRRLCAPRSSAAPRRTPAPGAAGRTRGTRCRGPPAQSRWRWPAGARAGRGRGMLGARARSRGSARLLGARRCGALPAVDIMPVRSARAVAPWPAAQAWQAPPQPAAASPRLQVVERLPHVAVCREHHRLQALLRGRHALGLTHMQQPLQQLLVAQLAVPAGARSGGVGWGDLGACVCVCGTPPRKSVGVRVCVCWWGPAGRRAGGDADKPDHAPQA